MTSTRLLAVVVVLQALILLGQWTGAGPVTPAYAQIPDAGSQRASMLEELRSINGKMARVVQILESGKIQVQVSKPDEGK